MAFAMFQHGLQQFQWNCRHRYQNDFMALFYKIVLVILLLIFYNIINFINYQNAKN